MWERRKYIESIKKFERHIFQYDRRSDYNSVLIYPGSYFTGMSYLGFHSIFHHMNEKISLTDRYFYEREEDMITWDENRYLSDHEFLLFTIPYEPMYEDIIEILKKANIEPDRRKRKKAPVLIAGGPGLWVNPYPVKNVFDYFVFGSGCDKLDVIFEKREKIFKGGFDFRGIVNEISTNKASYLDQVVFSDGSFLPSSGIITERTFFSNMLLIEISRGCAQRCSFCTVSRLYNNTKFHDHKAICEMMLKGMEYTNRFGLISSMVLSHPGIKDILDIAISNKLEVSTSSVNLKDIDTEIVEKLYLSGNKSLTIAIESMSEKSREYVKKELSDRKILENLEIIFKGGIKKVKIYLISGLRFEKENVFKQKDLWESIMNLKSRYNAEIHFSINPLIPKPFTPFEKLPMPEKKEIRSNYNFITSNFSGVKMDFENVNNCIKQYEYAHSKEDILEKNN